VKRIVFLINDNRTKLSALMPRLPLETYSGASTPFSTPNATEDPFLRGPAKMAFVLLPTRFG
jgi:hypothetical protein